MKLLQVLQKVCQRQFTTSPMNEPGRKYSRKVWRVPINCCASRIWQPDSGKESRPVRDTQFSRFQAAVPYCATRSHFNWMACKAVCMGCNPRIGIGLSTNRCALVHCISGNVWRQLLWPLRAFTHNHLLGRTGEHEFFVELKSAMLIELLTSWRLSTVLSHVLSKGV